MIENPVNGRAVIRQEYNSMVVEIPAKRHWAHILFMMVWLGGWAVGEYFAVNTLLSSDGPLFANAFILFWLVGWTFGGGVAFYTVLWQLIGREIISVESGLLTIKRSVFGLGSTRKFETGSIKNMHVIPDQEISIPGIYNKKLSGRQGGKIRFDYGMKTIRFGMDIEEPEANMIIDRLRQNGYLRSENFNSDKERQY